MAWALTSLLISTLHLSPRYTNATCLEEVKTSLGRYHIADREDTYSREGVTLRATPYTDM
jgi:hypothetical protein